MKSEPIVVLGIAQMRGGRNSQLCTDPNQAIWDLNLGAQLRNSTRELGQQVWKRQRRLPEPFPSQDLMTFSRQDPEFSNADQMDLYDDVLAASSQPQEKRSSSSEAPPEIRQEPSPKANSKPPAILYTYSGLRNKRAAVYVGSFSWVSSSSRGVWDSWDSEGSCRDFEGAAPPQSALSRCPELDWELGLAV